jgi:hypothetical protein
MCSTGMDKTLNYEVALKQAANVVNASAVAGQLDTANPNTMSSFSVRFERGTARVSLSVEMDYMAASKTFVLKVQTSFGSTHRTMPETREFLALLTAVTEVGEKVVASLAGTTFVFEK